MVSVALRGGVMHASGAPLQAWFNLLFVRLNSEYPAWGLSFFSWACHLGSGILLLASLRILGVPLAERLLGATFLAFFPALWALSLQPEKYALLNFTVSFAIWTYLKSTQNSESWRWKTLNGAACGLALSLHLVGVVVWPLMWTRNYKKTLAATFLAVGIAAVFYLSLLTMRSDSHWVDWGNLRSVGDVWNHFARKDFQWTKLYATPKSGQEFLSGLWQLALGLRFFPIAFFFVPLGLLHLFKTKRCAAVKLGVVTAGIFAILWQARLPDDPNSIAQAYAQRYSAVALPVLALFFALGIFYVTKKFSRLRAAILAFAGASSLALISLGYLEVRSTDNSLVEIYREQASFELPKDALYASSNDFELLYGLPCASGTCFPLNNLLGYPWYFEVALTLHPAIKDLLRDFPRHPSHFGELLQMAVDSGVTVAMTSAGPLESDSRIMEKAEQTGLLWIFRREQTHLYSERILQNSLRLCENLSHVRLNGSISASGFSAQFLQNFRLVFMSAGDYLEANQRAPQAAAARALVEALVPGQAKDIWQTRCQNYRNAMSGL